MRQRKILEWVIRMVSDYFVLLFLCNHCWPLHFLFESSDCKFTGRDRPVTMPEWTAYWLLMDLIFDLNDINEAFRTTRSDGELLCHFLTSNTETQRSILAILVQPHGLPSMTAKSKTSSMRPYCRHLHVKCIFLRIQRRIKSANARTKWANCFSSLSDKF